MQCPDCHTQNHPGETFCVACGAQIARLCPVCGTENARDLEFCSYCTSNLGVCRPPLGPFAVPLINRDGELAAVEMAASRATQGFGQVVGVLGMPGVGKSRLCREMAARWQAAGMPVYEVRCQVNGNDVPLLTLRELLRRLCNLEAEDGWVAGGEKVAAAINVLGGDTSGHVPFIQSFLGVADPEFPLPEMEAEAREQMFLEVATQLVLERSKTQPMMVVLYDAQWLDAASDAFVARLIERMTDAHLLVLLTFRPGYHAPWTAKAHYHQLALRPLAPEASEEVLRALLGDDSSVNGGIPVLVRRTRGYPYFIEEAVRLLAMTNVLRGKPGRYRLTHPLEAHEVPATIESVITARSECLDDMERRVLYAASIIGGWIPTPVLRRVADVSDRDLWRLVRRLHESAFLVPDSSSQALWCSFVHPLAQEVVYYSQPPQKRAHLHGVVANVLEEEYAGSLGEYASLIAHHWEAANDKFKADLWRRRAARGVKRIRVQRIPQRTDKR